MKVDTSSFVMPETHAVTAENGQLHMHTCETAKTRVNARKSGNGYRVKPYRNTERPHLKWQVVGPNRRRNFFRNRGEADTFARLRKMEFERLGSDALKLSGYEVHIAKHCLEKLAPYNISLEQATQAAIETETARQKSCTIENACAEFLHDRREYSRHEFNAIRRLTERLCDVFGGKLISDICTRDLEEFLTKIGSEWSKRSRNQWRSRLCRLWKCADTYGHCAEKVARKINWHKPADTEIGILTCVQAALLIAAAPVKIFAGVAIGLFAGLRTSEICRLDWRHIILHNKPDETGCYGIIRVLGRTSKTADHRHVDITPNLAAWLWPLRKASGPVVVPNGTAYFDELLKPAADKAGIAEWPNNALRHSFGSYHYARFRSLKDTMFQMGHMNQYTFLKHYHKLVTREEAMEYWQIAPFSRPELADIHSFAPDAYPWARTVHRIIEGEFISGTRNLAHYFGVDQALVYYWFNHRSDCPPRPPDDRFHVPTWQQFVRSHPEWNSNKFECTELFYVSWHCGDLRTCDQRRYFTNEDDANEFANMTNRDFLAKELQLEAIENVIEFSSRSLSADTAGSPLPHPTIETAGTAYLS